MNDLSKLSIAAPKPLSILTAIFDPRGTKLITMKKSILLTLAIIPLAACATDSSEPLAPDSPTTSPSATSPSASASTSDPKTEASVSAEATESTEVSTPIPTFVQEISVDQPVEQPAIVVEPSVEPSAYDDEFVTGVTPPDIYIPNPDATDVPNPEATEHESEN